MRILFLALLSFLLLILQIAVFSRLSFYGATFNLLLVAPIFWVLYFSDNLAVATFVFISGFFLDMYSGAPLGAFFISFIASIAVLYFLAHNFFRHANFLIFCLIVALGSILHYFIYFAILNFYGVSGGFLAFQTLTALVTLNVAAAIVLYFPLRKILQVVMISKK